MEMNQTLLGLIALFSVGISVFLGAVILGTFEQQTSGQCTEGYSSIANTTISNNVTEFQHGFLLSNVLNDDATDSGNLTITYANKSATTDGSACQIWVGVPGSWTSLGKLDNVSPNYFTFTAAQISPMMNINYSTCKAANITQASITYASLTGSGCGYTYNAYKTIKAVNKNVTGVMSIASILPYILVIVVVLGAFGAFLYMRKD
jgi:hypothetical protein